jgi:mannose-6-phosphate isomerase-like protein (cupin superfamily)
VLVPGTSFDIPPGCAFQLRAHADVPLQAVAVTMPPWTGDDEAREVSGPWTPSVPGAVE